MKKRGILFKETQFSKRKYFIKVKIIALEKDYNELHQMYNKVEVGFEDLDKSTTE